jgi:hypothetical protein
VKLQAFVMDVQPQEQTITLRIVIERDRGDKKDSTAENINSVIVSEGILTFVLQPKVDVEA